MSGLPWPRRHLVMAASATVAWLLFSWFQNPTLPFFNIESTSSIVINGPQSISSHSVIPISSAAPTPKPEPVIAADFAPSTPAPPFNLDRTKLAFLVETRPLPHLPVLYAHMISVVPPEWRFMFMGSPESIAHMRNSRVISYHESTGKLEIREIPPKYSVKSRESISQMFTDPALYSEILFPAEHLLVFQPDSIFCVNSEQSLNDWLEWDWVGAPWGPNIESGGNGGLSLRKVSRILTVLVNQKRRKGDVALEDLWLAESLKRLPESRMPNATISKRFSVESVWYDRPLGYHIGWLGVHHEQIWDTEEQLNHIWKYCPEVKLLLGMTLTGDKPAGVE